MSQTEILPSGEVVLMGTAIEVHRIAALVEGGSDYPSLTANQVDFAVAYARAHPNHGQPYPKLSAKAALRSADFSALNLDD